MRCRGGGDNRRGDGEVEKRCNFQYQAVCVILTCAPVAPENVFGFCGPWSLHILFWVRFCAVPCVRLVCVLVRTHSLSCVLGIKSLRAYV